MYKEILIGEKYGNWLVIGKEEVIEGKRGKYCLCECQCGSNIQRKVLRANLKNGRSKGCGACNRGCKRKNKYDLTNDYGIGWTSNTNKEFYFDKEDFSLIEPYLWRENDQGYCLAQRRGEDSRKFYRMHRIVLNAPEELQVDHINHNRLDNRKNNLRLVTNQQNSFNNTSEGVYYKKDTNKWCACIMYNGKSHSKTLVIMKRQKNIENF